MKASNIGLPVRFYPIHNPRTYAMDNPEVAGIVIGNNPDGTVQLRVFMPHGQTFLEVGVPIRTDDAIRSERPYCTPALTPTSFDIPFNALRDLIAPLVEGAVAAHIADKLESADPTTTEPDRRDPTPAQRAAAVILGYVSTSPPESFDMVRKNYRETLDDAQRNGTSPYNIEILDWAYDTIKAYYL